MDKDKCKCECGYEQNDPWAVCSLCGKPVCEHCVFMRFIKTDPGHIKLICPECNDAIKSLFKS